MCALPLLLFAADCAGPDPDRLSQCARTFNIDAPRNLLANSSALEARSQFAVRSAPGLIGLAYKWLDEGASGAVGQPLRVRLSVISAQAVDSLVAEVYAHEGLVVSPTGWSMGELPAQQRDESVLSVTPYADGPLRLSVLVQGQIDGQAQAAQITVPVPGYGLENP